MTNNSDTYGSRAMPIVHASAVSTGRGAFVFLGPSGTGKTTIHRLLSTSTHTQPLANEAVYLIQQMDREWKVSSADDDIYEEPLSRVEIASRDSVPLRGIFRLFQSSAPRVRQIGALRTCRYLTDALFEIVWQREHVTATKKVLFSNLAAVCRSVPGYEFHFDLSPRTVAVFNKVEQQIKSKIQ
jgi:energy-coupling factor transporter ATP-binding protein EcfA2